MHRLASIALPLVLAAAAATGLDGQAQEERPALEARVWLDRGEEPVLQRGDPVRVYYRTTEDAYGAIFRIDTDGVVSMIFPQRPGVTAPIRGGRDYRLLFPRSPVWPVEDDPGVGYFFMVASPEPLDFSAFTYDPRFGWDLGAVGGLVYDDPYVAIDEYVAQLMPDWEVVPYALDFLTYHVGNTYSYPRFLCYDCHAYQSYASWNPYSVACTSFRVVIWDDPYFYPAYRYSGTRVVVARPVRAVPRYQFVTRRPGDGFRPLVRRRDAPERSELQFKEPAATPASSVVPLRRRAQSSPSAQQVPGATPRGQEAQDTEPGRPTLQRRPASPSARLPVRTPPSSAAPRQPTRSVSPGAPTRTERSGGARPAPRGDDPRASPTRPDTRRTPTRSAPSRPSTTPSRPTTRTAPAPRREPSARPTTPNRPSTRPSTPAPSRPSTRPSAPAPSRPSARPATPSRESAPRPTVRPRRPRSGN